jgi:hypothetical protein
MQTPLKRSSGTGAQWRGGHPDRVPGTNTPFPVTGVPTSEIAFDIGRVLNQPSWRGSRFPLLAGRPLLSTLQPVRELLELIGVEPGSPKAKRLSANGSAPRGRATPGPHPRAHPATSRVSGWPVCVDHSHVCGRLDNDADARSLVDHEFGVTTGSWRFQDLEQVAEIVLRVEIGERPVAVGSETATLLYDRVPGPT